MESSCYPSKVILGSLKLAPGAQGELSLDQLINDVTYNINCNIFNDNEADVYENVHNENNSMTGPFATLDGKVIDLQVMHLDNQTSSHNFSVSNYYIRNHRMHNSSSILFQNLDDQATVALDNCEANPQLKPVMPPRNA